MATKRKDAMAKALFDVVNLAWHAGQDSRDPSVLKAALVLSVVEAAILGTDKRAINTLHLAAEQVAERWGWPVEGDATARACFELEAKLKPRADLQTVAMWLIRTAAYWPGEAPKKTHDVDAGMVSRFAKRLEKVELGGKHTGDASPRKRKALCRCPRCESRRIVGEVLKVTKLR